MCINACIQSVALCSLSGSLLRRREGGEKEKEKE